MLLQERSERRCIGTGEEGKAVGTTMAVDCTSRNYDGAGVFVFGKAIRPFPN